MTDLESRVRTVEDEIKLIKHVVFGHEHSTASGMYEQMQNFAQALENIRSDGDKGRSRLTFITVVSMILSIITMLTVTFAVLIQ
jgi:hypothetical protein